MQKILATALITVCLHPAFTAAQTESTVPQMAAFSHCLKTAVDAERANTVSDSSLNRVKKACARQQQALVQALPPDIARHIIGLLDENLQRELHR
jgi:hypothetical protein